MKKSSIIFLLSSALIISLSFNVYQAIWLNFHNPVNQNKLLKIEKKIEELSGKYNAALAEADEQKRAARLAQEEALRQKVIAERLQTQASAAHQEAMRQAELARRNEMMASSKEELLKKANMLHMKKLKNSNKNLLRLNNKLFDYKLLNLPQFLCLHISMR